MLHVLQLGFASTTVVLKSVTVTYKVLFKLVNGRAGAAGGHCHVR